MAYIDDVNSILQIQPDGMPTVVRLSQNENGRNLYFTLSGNEAAIPSTVTVTISGTKPDGNVYSGTGSIDDDVVLIQETVQMTAVAGTWDAKIKIISGDNTIATGRVRFVIDADTVAAGAVPSDSELEGIVAEAQAYAESARSAAYGSPLTAATASAMTDRTKVYVYTGSESGYTAGHWYYWNGSAWTDGGVYNAVAVQTDKTLTVEDKAADAEATGYAIDNRNAPSADQLISNNYTIDQTPYLYRQTNSNGADRAIEEIVGGSINYNQWCNTSSSVTRFGITATADSQSSKVTFNGTATADFSLNWNMSNVATGHKILFYGCPSGGSSSTYYGRNGYYAETSLFDLGSGKVMENQSATPRFIYQFIIKSGTTVNNMVVAPQMFDLTTMFGTTIADYIYSLEQNSAGAGVAFFRKLFPEEYYAYDAGTMRHVSGVSAKVTKDADGNVVGNYPLDSSLTLRGIPKLDSNNQLYYDGDTYESDGTVTRRYGIRAYQSGDVTGDNMITDGTNTVYKLTTPTTETADPYTNPQICDPYGTEEFVSTSLVPVGHYTKYPANLRAAIERVMEQIPEAPTANGTYTLKATRTSSGITYAWTAS